MTVFLAGFAVLLAALSRYFLIPALLASHEATESEKKLLSGSATLLLAVVLFILLMGIMLVLRLRRFFLPQSPAKPVRTQYVDAWSESARRMKTPESDTHSSSS